jgi:putative ABC transport system permease protein
MTRTAFKLAVSNMLRQKAAWLPFLLSACVCAGLLYTVCALSANAASLGLPGLDALQELLNMGRFVVLFFVAVFLFYTDGYLFKQRKKELALYGVLGMNRSQIILVSFFQLCIVFVLALGLGIVSGLLLSKGVMLLLARMLDAPIPYGFAFSTSAASQTAILLAVVFAAALARQAWMVGRMQLSKLLKTEPEKEPKVHWLLGTAGIILLAAGYGISLMMDNPLKALTMFFTAVLLVIAGTYLLMSCTSIVILKVLQKNKKFYYQPNHFLGISNMKFRMKSNGISLANIAILLTMVLVALSSSISLYAGIEDIVQTNYPRQVQLSSWVYSAEELAQMPDNAENMQVYTYFECAASLTEGNVVFAQTNLNDFSYLSVTSVSDWNRNAGTDYALTDDQVLVYDPGQMVKEGTLTIAGREFEVVRTDETFMSASAMDAAVYLAFNDLDWVYEAQAAGYQENASKLMSIVNYDGTAIEDMENVTVRVREEQKRELKSLYAGLLFVGMLVTVLFITAAALIIWYKQISEGMEDRRRWDTLAKVGMDEKLLKKAVNFQMFGMFLLPLLAALIHLAFAYPILSKLLQMFGLGSASLFLWCTLWVAGGISLVYAVLYGAASRTYRKIVTS